jgi:hypothetical protein
VGSARLVQGNYSLNLNPGFCHGPANFRIRKRSKSIFGATENSQVEVNFFWKTVLAAVLVKSLLLHTYAELGTTFIVITFKSKVHVLYNFVNTVCRTQMTLCLSNVTRICHLHIKIILSNCALIPANYGSHGKRLLLMVFCNARWFSAAYAIDFSHLHSNSKPMLVTGSQKVLNSCTFAGSTSRARYLARCCRKTLSTPLT